MLLLRLAGDQVEQPLSKLKPRVIDDSINKRTLSGKMIKGIVRVCALAEK